MTLKEELLKEFSKPHVVYLSNKIGPDQEAFDELIMLFLHDEYRVTQRAAWVVSHCADNHPWLLEKHLESIILNLQNDINDAVKRNTVRVLQHMEIPEDLMGILADICFGFLNSGKEPVAIKAHSITILYNIAKKYPELKEELMVSIEDQMPYASVGLKNRGNKILKKLQSL